MSGEKYAKEDQPGSYRHDFHAGNVGDVWKHTALCAVLRTVRQAAAPLTLLDCHGGSGRYRLEGAGEWNEGVERLLAQVTESQQQGIPCLREYLGMVRSAGFSTSRHYPGSPLLLKAFARPEDLVVCCETDERAAAALRENTALEVRSEDGLLHLQALAAERRPFFALIDPPWAAKQDWRTVPAALVSAWRACPAACFMLWYPIKSYTRVAAMHKQLGQAGLPCHAFEVITTPLEHQRKRLNGSGVIVAQASAELVSELSAAASAVAAACAVFAGRWQVRIVSGGC